MFEPWSQEENENQAEIEISWMTGELSGRDDDDDQSDLNEEIEQASTMTTKFKSSKNCTTSTIPCTTRGVTNE